jgi:hypothetical protein
MVKKIKVRAKRPIRVESHAVYVVPFSQARSYVRWEIESEGHHRTGVVPIVLFPRSEAGTGNQEWVEMIFASLEEGRRTHGREAFETPNLLSDGRPVDIGLIDIPAKFKENLNLVTSNMAHRSYAFLDENLRHVDRLFAGMFHDQMTLATVLHAVSPDGSPCIHYHNLIFGIRREFRNGHTLIGSLDFRPVLEALTRKLRLCVVAEPKPARRCDRPGDRSRRGPSPRASHSRTRGCPCARRTGPCRCGNRAAGWAGPCRSGRRRSDCRVPAGHNRVNRGSGSRSATGPP